MEEKKETLGHSISSLLQKPIDHSDASVAEVSQERADTGYPPLFLRRLEKIKTDMPDNRDFYLEVHYRIPYLSHGLADQWDIYGRLTCPAPTFDQTVYIYHRESADVELIWTIPHITGCVKIDENFLSLPREQRQLANWVMEFKHGTLYKNAKKINTDLEKPAKATDSLILA